MFPKSKRVTVSISENYWVCDIVNLSHFEAVARFNPCSAKSPLKRSGKARRGVRALLEEGGEYKVGAEVEDFIEVPVHQREAAGRQGLPAMLLVRGWAIGPKCHIPPSHAQGPENGLWIRLS